jgi:hypothetical protein
MDPWLQRPDESGTAYAAFKVYLELGPGRTLEAAGFAIYPPGSGRAKKGRKQGATGTVRKWAAAFDWAARARAYDDRQESIRRQAEEKAAAEAAQRWAKRRDVLDERTWTAADLLARRAQDLATFPVSRKTVADGGKQTIIEPIGGRELRSAAAVHVAADTLARKALDSQATAPASGSEARAVFEAAVLGGYGDGDGPTGASPAGVPPL